MPQPVTSPIGRLVTQTAGRCTVRPVEMLSRSLHLGRLHLAADLVACALGHVLPFVRVVVRLRAQPGARVLGGAAVVLARLGDAVTLLAVLRLRGGLRGGRRDEAEREEAGN